MSFEYKCVAGPTIVAVKSARARDQAVKAFEDIMNAEAASGWEYVGIDEFHVSEPQGMFTRKRVYVPSKILVFRRAKAQPVTALNGQAASGVVGAAAQAAAAAAPIPAKDPEATAATSLTSASLSAQEPEQLDAPKSMKAIADKLKSANTAKEPG